MKFNGLTAEKIFSVLLVLLPFLYQYRGVGNIISFGELLLLPVVVVLAIQTRGKIHNPNFWLLAFYVVSCVGTLLCAGFSYFRVSAAASVIFRLVFYGVVVYLAKDHFVLAEVSKLYTGLVAVFSVYLLMQYIYHYSTGGYLPIYIRHDLLFPPEARAEALQEYYRWAFRASSLFLEPSYFALYALPAVSLLLYKKVKRKVHIIELIVICVALIFSTASSGLAGLVIIYAVYLFDSVKKISSKKLVTRLFVFFVACSMTIGYFVLSENAEFFGGRLLSGGSVNHRITRGILIYQELPLINKIIGVGLNNLEPYMLANNISTIYDEANLNYSSSLVQTLNYSGVVGLLVLVGYLINLYRTRISRKSFYGDIKVDADYEPGILLSMFLLYIFIMGYESILFMYRFAFLSAILLGVSNEFHTGRVKN